MDDNQDIPRYMKQNKERFEYMLDRDAENAGFVCGLQTLGKDRKTVLEKL